MRDFYYDDELGLDGVPESTGTAAPDETVVADAEQPQPGQAEMPVQQPVSLLDFIKAQYGPRSETYRNWWKIGSHHGSFRPGTYLNKVFPNHRVVGQYIDANMESHAMIQYSFTDNSGEVVTKFADINLDHPEPFAFPSKLDRGVIQTNDSLPVTVYGAPQIAFDHEGSDKVYTDQYIKDNIADNTNFAPKDARLLSGDPMAVYYRKLQNVPLYAFDGNVIRMYSAGQNPEDGIDTTTVEPGYFGNLLNSYKDAYKQSLNGQPTANVQARGGRLRIPTRNSYGDRVARAEGLGGDDYDVYF